MKVGCIIEARMRSTRLPGKVLKPLAGRPLLERLVERVRRVRGIDEIVIATTSDPSCDAIAELAARIGVRCFRGSEDDVLERVLLAAKANAIDVIVETTGDNPLLDPRTVERVLESYLGGGADYVSNVLERTYPRGLSVQVFSTALLADVAARTQEPRHREHVTLYMYEEPGRYRLRNIASDLPASVTDLRVTVDTAEDFEVVRRIFEGLYPQKPEFDLGDILAFFAGHADLRAVNAHVQQRVASPRVST